MIGQRMVVTGRGRLVFTMVVVRLGVLMVPSWCLLPRVLPGVVPMDRMIMGYNLVGVEHWEDQQQCHPQPTIEVPSTLGHDATTLGREIQVVNFGNAACARCRLSARSPCGCSNK
jgi:hypothetical protein